MRRILILLSTCLMLLVGVAAPAGADSGITRPFAGMASGQVTFVPTELPRVCPTFPFLTTTVTNIPGRARHLGRMSLSSQHCAGFGLIEGGEMVLVAANGDKVLIEYTVDAPIVPSTAFDVDVDGTIVDGTGRFDDASGHVDMTGSVTMPHFPDSFADASVSFVWTGHITY
jgi:hypothetical protein